MKTAIDIENQEINTPYRDGCVEVRYLPATDRSGARVKLSLCHDMGFSPKKKSLTFPWDYRANNTAKNGTFRVWEKTACIPEMYLNSEKGYILVYTSSDWEKIRDMFPDKK